jgi:ribonuclease-3
VEPDLNDYKKLETRLGYAFKRVELLVLSLTHPSWNQDQPNRAGPSNQRLEFLGDSVLNLIVAEEVFHHFSDQPEGLLTRTRSALVKGKVLFQFAEALGIEPFLRLGKSETQTGDRGRQSRL